jgi:4-hydroxybenzoate polyprenyltransferase
MGRTTSERRTVARTVSTLLVTSRPRFWLYLAGPALVGLAFGVETLGALGSPAAVALFGYFLLPANVFLYGINDVYDAAADRLNPRKAEREARFDGDPIVVGGTIVGGSLGLLLAAALGGVAGAAVLGFVVLGAAYSAPPLRLKGRPPLDSLSNGLYILPGVAAYAAVAGVAPPTLAVLGGWLWAMGMHTFSAIPDVEPDRRAGIQTTATVLGRRNAMGYVAACWLLAAGAFGGVDGRLGALMLSYPLLLGGVAISSVAVDRAYWWFPAVNTAVGATMTVAGLWVMAGG